MDLAGGVGEASAHPPADVPQRRRSLGRFPGRTEAGYRRWAAAEAFPVVRAVGWLSVLIWAAVPVFMALVLDGGTDLTVARIVSWGVSIPAILGGLLLGVLQRRPSLVAAGLTLTTLNSLVVVVSLDLEQGPMLMASMAVFCLYLAPVLRLPITSTAVFLVLTVPVAAGWALRKADRDGTWDAALGIQLWLLGVSSLLALSMSWAAESSSRRRYAAEQLLGRQQAQLARSRELVRRYAPAAVVERLERGDATVGVPQRERVTIFFVDAVGFTAMADRVDPEALAEIMNGYLGAVAEIVERHGGTLSEFAGDGVMAIFGAPEPMPAPAQVRAALGAAAELQRALPRLSESWYPLGIDRALQARVGVNTGVVSVGTFGSAGRATYTAIGLQTNIAARVQARCPPGSVLLSSTSWHLVKDEVPCEAHGEVEVKGVHFPIAVYEPLREDRAGSTTSVEA